MGTMDEQVWTVDDHLRGADPAHVELWRAFAALVESCGPVTYAVSKTTITFKGARRGFAGARPTRQGVEGYLDTMRPLDGDPRILRSSPYLRTLYVNRYRIRTLADLDDTFAGWVREAYEVGGGAHLR
jgi:hypothetical protein